MKNQRKTFLMLFFLLTLMSTGMAQPRFRKPLRESGSTRIRFEDWNLGLKLGSPWNLLTKSNISPVYLGHFGYEFGISAERHHKSLAVGLEVLWARRGTRMMGQSQYQSSLHTLDTMQYISTIKYDVVTARVPITWYIMPPTRHRVTPYAFVAPGIEHSPGILNLQADSFKEFLQEPIVPAYTTSTQLVGSSSHNETSDWSPPYLDVTLTAGAGALVILPTKSLPMAIKFDLAARLGLLNLATETLKDEGIAIRSGGIEAGLTFFFGIRPPLQDASRSFQKRTLSIKLP